MTDANRYEVELKFPLAEPSFRLGLARTIVEEQKHLGLYVARMRELGVDFGQLPISDYFWNALKNVTSPLDFVVHMSLTLEQANLDFSLFYQQAVAAVGDEKTSALLEVVYREEIGHVKHGVTWFNRWRERSPGGREEDDWEAYLRCLKPPMNPRRAKGPLYCAAARREAGLSERYISEMEVYSGSKGRPPAYWLYNPLCESEIVRGKPGFTGTKKVQNLGLDLEVIPAFLALETDVILARELPRAAWLKSLQATGIRLPEFRKLRPTCEPFPERHIAGFEPWGWSPDSFAHFKSGAPKLIRIAGGNGAWASLLLKKADFTETGLRPLFSKTWSLDFYRDWMEKHPEAAQTVSGCSINLSAASMVDESFSQFLKTRILTSSFSARKLIFEITETSAVRDLSRAQNLINDMRTLGCRFALDDFGTGFCSFNYLRNLDVDYFKIDGSFVRDLQSSALSMAVIKSITDIAQVLNKKTTAEHCENKELADILLKLNVDYVQGFGIHKPEPIDEYFSTNATKIAE